MFDIGFLEMMVIGILALIVLGPERLPGAIKSCVQTVRSIKEMANGFKQEVSAQIDAHELHANLKKAEELGMKNIGKDLQDSVDELKAAAASVQRPYQQSKSKFEENTIASSPTKDNQNPFESQVPEVDYSPESPSDATKPSSSADFDDYQHNDTPYGQDDSSEQGQIDSSFDNSLLEENIHNNNIKEQARSLPSSEKASSNLKAKDDNE